MDRNRRIASKSILGIVLFWLIVGGAAIFMGTMVFTNGFQSKNPIPAKVVSVESHIRMWGQYANVAILNLSNGETCTLETDLLAVGDEINVYYRWSNDTCVPAE